MQTFHQLKGFADEPIWNCCLHSLVAKMVLLQRAIGAAAFATLTAIYDCGMLFAGSWPSQIRFWLGQLTSSFNRKCLFS